MLTIFRSMSRRRTAPRFDDKRTPLARMESLIAEHTSPRRKRIFGRIKGELDESAKPGPWIAAAQTLHERGLISADAVVFFVEHFLECVTFEAVRNDPEMVRLQDEMERMERAHGLSDGEYFLLDEAPSEWRALSDAWERRDGEIKVALLRALGHNALAELLANNPSEFEGRGATGHYEFWGEGDDDEGG